MPGCGAARIARAASRPSVVWVGGIRTSTTTTSGSVRLDDWLREPSRRGLADDLEPGAARAPASASRRRTASSASTNPDGRGRPTGRQSGSSAALGGHRANGAAPR